MLTTTLKYSLLMTAATYDDVAYAYSAITVNWSAAHYDRSDSDISSILVMGLSPLKAGMKIRLGFFKEHWFLGDQSYEFSDSSADITANTGNFNFKDSEERKCFTFSYKMG
jgi:hypothetical protein